MKNNYSQVLVILLLGFIPMTLFFGSCLELTSSAFLREGKNIWTMKVYPIQTKLSRDQDP